MEKTKLPAAIQLICVIVSLVMAGPSLADDLSPAERRDKLIHYEGPDGARAAAMARALSDPDPVVARTAARLLARCGKGALPEIVKALDHKDRLVRKMLILALGGMGPDGIEPLSTLAKDEDPFIRHATILALSGLRPRCQQAADLLNAARDDESAVVREAAMAATRDFYLIREAIELPADGWKFKLDPENGGETAKWFVADFDDTGWDDIGIGKAWQLFGYDYQGYGWYRRVVELPQMPKPAKTEIAFGGVDENAWVWVNGEYAGDHAIGPAGWDKPFSLDITKLLKPGAENQITVRAMNTVGHGGIWLPVHIKILDEVD